MTATRHTRTPFNIKERKKARKTLAHSIPFERAAKAPYSTSTVTR